MRVKTNFREPRFIRKLRKNPTCKHLKGCPCNIDFLIEYDAVQTLLERQIAKQNSEPGSSLGKGKASLLTQSIKPTE